jgi:hypothetical protein
MVTMLAMREHGLNHAKVNVYSSACALGHPVGSTGSRIILTVINALQNTGDKRGIASLCIGGGRADLSQGQGQEWLPTAERGKPRPRGQTQNSPTLLAAHGGKPLRATDWRSPRCRPGQWPPAWPTHRGR